MTLNEYVDGVGRGEIARLARVSGVAYGTVLKLARKGEKLDSYSKAKSLSDATGGKVSIKELCEKSAIDSTESGHEAPSETAA